MTLIGENPHAMKNSRAWAPFDFFARKNGAVVPVANKPDF
jgi:hypothetical protein